MSTPQSPPLSAVAAADAAAVAARIISSSQESCQCGHTPAAAAAAAGGAGGPARSPTGSPQPDQWSLGGMLTHNHDFVLHKKFEPYLTDRFPYKKLVVVTCMDTRLVELLPVALDLKNGDAKIIKVAGAIVTHPFGSVMRSILVAVYALGAEHIVVVGHHDWSATTTARAAEREIARPALFDDGRGPWCPLASSAHALRFFDCPFCFRLFLFLLPAV